jgi:hypothetical protein
MTGPQYEELCRFFIADQLQIPVEHVLSVQIPNARRGRGSGYGHQIDLFWTTGNNVTRYINIANAKWRGGRNKVRQGDVLLLQKVKEKVGAHKAVMITNSCYTSEARAVADDDGIGLIVVQPAFNPRKLDPSNRRRIMDHIQKVAKTKKDVYTYHIEAKGPDAALPECYPLEDFCEADTHCWPCSPLTGPIVAGQTCGLAPTEPWPFAVGGRESVLLPAMEERMAGSLKGKYGKPVALGTESCGKSLRRHRRRRSAPAKRAAA